MGRAVVATGFILAASFLALLHALSPAALPAGAQSKDPVVVLETTKGPIAIRVFYSMVPYTAGNFLDLVEQGFYSNLSFHRIENWVVQGGCPVGNGSGNYVDPATGQPRFLKLEINNRLNHNAPGRVAMARSNNPNSASCQFYILKSPMAQLNGKYAVFGQVISGMQSVYAMRRGDRILSATVAQQGGPEPAAPANAAPEGYSGGPPPKTVDSGF